MSENRAGLGKNINLVRVHGNIDGTSSDPNENLTSVKTSQRLSLLMGAALILFGCTGGGTDSSAESTFPTASTASMDGVTTVVAEVLQPRVGGPKTLNVPADFATIQLAVDDAQPNDLILVAPGKYAEEVIVRTPSIVIRGEDRNTVILDGNDELSNGIQVSANGVAVENLTVQRYQVNGVVFTKAYDSTDPAQAEVLKGYRASYVTTANNGLYGLYAFFASGGQFDHVYGSGHPDGGIYIGQCKPCNAVVTDALMERNGIGYSGTNASGNLFIVNSVWRRNRIGLTPNSQDMEILAPQGDVVIAGNLVQDNNDPETPPAASGAFGFGIAIGGGERNLILRNRVTGNSSAGISVGALKNYVPSSNRIEGNVLSGNGTDLGFYGLANPTLTSKNCFIANTFSTSSPASIEQVLACDNSAKEQLDTDAALFSQPGPPPFDYRKVPLPPSQPQMPSPLSTPAVPASPKVPSLDLSTIKVPS